MGNLTLAWRKARKGKTSNKSIIEFDREIERNLVSLHYELRNKTYKPKPLVNFILYDPKTRVISKSDFRDRVVHHALINVIKHIFEKQFIYDSCANQIGKGTMFALERFRKYQRKVTKNFSQGAFCLKADIKHYFPEVDHEILLNILGRKVKDENVLWLIRQILDNGGCLGNESRKGMPLGNYTSQFFANVYLNELDYYVKHEIKVKYYIRYVDDFVIMHKSRRQLETWKEKINEFLLSKLKVALHPQKSRIMPISRGIDFVGFRNYRHFRLLRRRNIKSMRKKIELYKNDAIGFSNIFDSYQGWQAHAKWASTFRIRKKIKEEIIDIMFDKI